MESTDKILMKTSSLQQQQILLTIFVVLTSIGHLKIYSTSQWEQRPNGLNLDG